MKLPTAGATALAEREVSVRTVSDLSVEVVSDSGEGAQKCGQIFGAGLGQDGQRRLDRGDHPRRGRASSPQPRRRVGHPHPAGRAAEVTNWGDETNVVVAFNEQALLGRHRLNALADDAVILMENMWATHPDPRDPEAVGGHHGGALGRRTTRIVEVPMEEQCLTVVDNPRQGKNMFALGLLCLSSSTATWSAAASRSPTPSARRSTRSPSATATCSSWDTPWAAENLDFRYEIPTMPEAKPMVVMNGNEAIALGRVAAGMELAAMYPITPATSVSHMLGEVFETLRRRGAPGRRRDRRGRRRDRGVVRRQGAPSRSRRGPASPSRPSSWAWPS